MKIEINNDLDQLNKTNFLILIGTLLVFTISLKLNMGII